MIARKEKRSAGETISLSGVRQHNLRNLSLDLPRDLLIVVTGPSGSGKSSLAFDVLFAEGQRRYIDTLSPYARQFIQQLDRPDCDRVDGIPPAIAIEQRTTQGGSKTTVATLTEIWHFLRLLYSKLGVQHCHRCGKRLIQGSAARIEQDIQSRLEEDKKSILLVPVVRGRKGHYRELLAKHREQGFEQARVDGKWVSLKPGLALDRYQEHDIDLVFPWKERKLSQALELGKGVVRVLSKDLELNFSLERSCPDCKIGYPELDPRAFSFHSKRGACERCEGYGFLMVFDEDLLIPDSAKSLLEGAVLVFEGEPFTAKASELFARQVREALKIDPAQSWAKLPAKSKQLILNGDSHFEGLIPRLNEYMKKGRGTNNLSRFQKEQDCPACHGHQLRPESLAVCVEGKSIGELASLSVSEAKKWILSLRWNARQRGVAEGILRELAPKFDFLEGLGLSYLNLNRRGDTLSGGESQRIRLAASLGSHLTGVLYVLDEPTIGLHPRDHGLLLDALRKLRDRGNSVVVVEHDEDTIRSADSVVDLGPGAGKSGGELVFFGKPEKLIGLKESATGRALAGENRRRFNPRPNEPPKEWIWVRGAKENNLKNIDVGFPIGKLSVIAGVSGSGKSTLARDILFHGLKRKLLKSPVLVGKHDRIEGAEAFARVAEVDQTPIGRTPRSVPASYIGFLDEIRRLFASTPEARARGYTASRFSFNTEGGRCEACKGQGKIRMEMNFLPDAYVHCEACGGKRFSAETLELTLKGQTIAEVLAMSASEAIEFFRDYPGIRRNLEMMERVGLGYLSLGQESPSLSGGEAQRIKLVEELGKWSGGKTLYLLDEPTTGLALSDISKLIDLFHVLVDRGDTVVVIEHNLEIIKEADWLIELGPEGGAGGGELVSVGHPLDLIRSSRHAGKSQTLPFLQSWFHIWGSRNSS